ncbi:hypothetical protein C2134_01535 [Chromobacterium sinusclupearum]|uniref:Uncharacterized protein n=1 Tax=Chromobacterium sinusclupearum TaxID=2077146 RepID=A0A2K4MTZ8_9NEIS|nr:hypothetical protein [Chromobacterium sinusclupearum]POB00460.1 hypothetical protein C2134_01535 [Chromobacterium sinusclupearum]
MGWLEFKWKVQDISERVGNFVSGGYLDKKKSERIVRWAKEQQEEAQERLEKARTDTREALDALGALKANILSTMVPEFLQVVEVLGSVKLRERQTHLENLKLDQMLHQVSELKAVSAQVSKLMLGGAGGALGGATLAAGAYGLAGIIGTASTGTAIGSLSGAAATNATLAWLGGGTLSAGGLGVSGGMAVLGGIAVVPAALLVMYLSQNHAKQRLNEARDFRDEVEVFEEQTKTIVAQADAIREAAKIMIDALDGMALVLKTQTMKMQSALRLAAEQALELQGALERPLLTDAGLMREEFLEYIATNGEVYRSVKQEVAV